MPISIDVGTRALHLVQGTARNKQLLIKRAVTEPLQSGLVQDGIIREYSGLEIVLRDMLAKYKINDRACCLTINGNHIYTRDLIVPKGNPKLMQDMVSFEIKSSMNNNKESVVEFVQSARPVPDKPEMLNVRASAIQKEYVDDYYKLLRNCKLKPVALDIHANAVNKLIAGRSINGKPIADNATLLLVDIGAFSSTAYIYNEGEIIYSRIMPIGGSDLERYVNYHNETFTDKEPVYLGSLDLSPDSLKQNSTLAEAAQPLLASLNDGITRIVQFVASRLQGKRVDNVFLFGRTAGFTGFSQTLSAELSMPTETIYHIDRVTMPDQVQLAPYINALGALIRLA